MHWAEFGNKKWDMSWWSQIFPERGEEVKSLKNYARLDLEVWTSLWPVEQRKLCDVRRCLTLGCCRNKNYSSLWWPCIWYLWYISTVFESDKTFIPLNKEMIFILSIDFSIFFVLFYRICCYQRRESCSTSVCSWWNRPAVSWQNAEACQHACAEHNCGPCVDFEW